MTFPDKYISAYSLSHMVIFLGPTKNNRAASNVLRNIAESIENNIKNIILLYIEIKYFRWFSRKVERNMLIGQII